MKRIVIIATFLLLTASALCAQTPPQVPNPGPEHQRLHHYVGDWKPRPKQSRPLSHAESASPTSPEKPAI